MKTKVSVIIPVYNQQELVIKAGGGWEGIAAVIELDQRRFYEN